MKIVIWGAGDMGRRVIPYLDKESIVAFIDNNTDKIGTWYFGIPIISIDEYEAKYNKIPILITPLAEEEILVQGIIDAWFEEGGAITVVDFKSDRVPPGGERARAEEYRPQLAAYSQALSAILGRPVDRQVLWFFATDTMIEL